MPIVPEQSTPSVAPQNVPDFRQQAPMFMMRMAEQGPAEQERVGQEMQQGGAAFTDTAIAQQININEGAVKNYDAQLMGGISTILHGSSDGSTQGYLSTQGGNAISAHQAAVEALSNLPQKLSQGLDNDAQRQMVAPLAQTRIAAALAQANQHNAQQTTIFHASASKLRIEAAANAAATSYNPVTDNALPIVTPAGEDAAPNANSAYQQAIRTVQTEAADLADLKGITDPDARRQFISDQVGAAYTNTIGRLLANNDIGGAQKYFGAVKGELDAQTANHVQETLDTANNKDFMLRYSDGLFAQGGDEQSQLKQLQADFDSGKVNAPQRLLIEQRIRLNASEQRQQQSENAQQALGQAQDFALHHPGTSVLDLPQPLYQALEKNGHLATAEAFFKRNQGEEAKGNPVLFNDLMDMSVNDPVKFSQIDPTTFVGKLSNNQLNLVWAARRGINKQDASQMETDKLVHSTIMSTRGQLASAGINVNAKPGDPAATQYATFESGLRTSLYSAIQKKGGALTPKEANDIALGMLKDQALAGSGFSLFGHTFNQTSKPVWQMSDQEKTQSWVIPPTDRQQITDSLKRANVPPTEANIQRAYKMKQGVY